ncbi:hypothetical protein T440DRAFT_108924 [Plenodomus tracheiphilus IPT5]|uniref:Uncharacterized protein n=1 Tax=Plenodomus tracheiphilus IPT5 TaxID=1408161 RepID=A0A6A7B794_9PLEO|nr:hypothetical protein T440DRAFT_108924 [Plenodomus tracheiphilus IPT5]
MSDSDGNQPSAAIISSKLRDVVIAIHKSGKTDDLTVKRVRARAEKELGLDEGFLKTDANWKQKSQEEIVDAVEKHCRADPTPQPTPKRAAPKPKAKAVEKKAKAATESARGVKRKAVPAKKPAKRTKPSTDEESEVELSDPSPELSAEESDAPKKPARRANKAVPNDSDDEDEASKPASKPSASLPDDDSDAEPVAPMKKANTREDVSDSDLSSVIDEEPVKKQRKKKDSAAPGKKASKTKATKAKTVDDPDQAKIKELQGWLVKCGIRKVWSRDPELSKCSTSKEKISVLRSMLKDVGMDGKFSVEKAAKIKEQREFAKDLEAIKEGEMAWGKTAEVTSTGRPSRRAAARPAPIQKIVLEDDSDVDMEGQDEGNESSDGDEDDDVQPDSEDDDDDDDNDKDDDSGADDSD